MSVVALNHNTAKARNVFAMADENDIMVEKIPCVARMQVIDAYFKSQYNGPTCLPRPMMEVHAYVDSLFIEDEDDRYFPCGEKEISFPDNEGQDVYVIWNLDETEIQDLVGKGLLREGFDVPPNLIGNTIEIPLEIKYRAIYESPFSSIEVMNPYTLQTSSYENNYYGIFEACPVHPDIVAEQQAGVMYSSQNERLMSDEYEEDDEYSNTYETEEYQDDYESEDENLLSNEELEDEAIQAQFKEKMKAWKEETDAEKKRRQDEQGNVDAGKLLWDDAKKANEEEQAREALENEQSDFYQYGLPGEKDDKKKSKKKKTAYEMLKQRNVRLADIAADNKALNDGITDIAGYGADEAPDKKHTSKPSNSKISARQQSGIDLANQLLGNRNSSGGHVVKNNSGPQFL